MTPPPTAPLAPLSRLVATALRAATAQLSDGARRNALGALQARYDTHRDDHEILAVLAARPAAPTAALRRPSA